MERRRSKRMFCLGAVLSALALAAAGVAYAASSSGSTGLASGDLLIKDTATSIAPGVTEHEVVTNNSSGNDQKIDYLCEVDLKGTSTTKIVAGYGADYSADSWGLTSTTAQAAGYEAKTGETVVAGINADFFNMATGEPMGALVMDGDVKHGANGRNFFAILKDGSAVIRDANGSLDDVQAAVGGDMLLIKDGQIPTDVATTEYGNLQYSRTAIGIKADGTVVTFVTHGRLYPVSCGRTYQEIAEMLKGAGCVSALALDGGGSSTYIARPEGTSGLELRNSPSDGAEREVSSSLLIVSTAKATGEFDHAVLTPNNEVYTPSSTITFEAAGADSSGKSCALPDGLTWKVASDSQSLGTIDAATGEFAASGKEGLLTVELMQGDKSVGQTTVDIAAPDQIYFASEEISLGFEAESDLGLVVRSKARDVHYNVGDIVWSSTNDEMGHFEGNTFISSDGKTLNGDVTATSKFNKDVKGTIHVVVGLLPTTVWDFEDQVDESGNTVSAEDYYTGENGILTHSNYGRGGKESIEIASSDNDEPVRFGNKSLKLNYDFTQCGEVTEGACIGTTQSMTVPGTPTGIGVWVYAPEGTGVTYEGDGSQAGFWLRGYVRDAAGNNMPYDFTLEPKACKDENGNWNGTQPGISWTGWKYLEADMTKLSAPLSIQPGMTFRLMFVNGTKMGTRTAGSIYFDNLQFVYGANVDDVDAPAVNSVSANGTALEDGAVLNANNVTFDAVLSDVENKYTSGVDVSTVRLNIDGVNTNGNDKFQFVPDPDGSQCHLYNVALSNGEHSVTVSLRDKFGNETSVTKHFTVKGEGIADVPTVTVVPKQSAAILGGTMDLQVKASDISKINAASVSLKIDNQFPDYTVTFSDAFEGTYEYKKLTGALVVDARRKAVSTQSAADDDVIATISIPVPTTLTDAMSFKYEVKSGSFTTTDGTFLTFSAPETSDPVAAAYIVSADPVIVGAKGAVKVVDAEGNPAEGVNVKYVNGDAEEALGATDKDGLLETDRFSNEAGSYVVFAEKDGRLSFRVTVSSFNAQGDEAGTPYGVMNHATADPTTEKSVSWLSSPKGAAKQVLQYARVSNGQAGDWVTVEASTATCTFTADGNFAAVVNDVMLKGLEPGATYRYRVGFDGAWSDEQQFETLTHKQDVSFFLLGDIQADDLTNIDNLMNQIKSKGYDFGIQTGDAVDDAVSYTDWKGIIDLFGTNELGDSDMLHVLGNHEYAGDADAVRAGEMYNLPMSTAGGYYSVTYGDVYIATINYTGDSTQFDAALQWLKQDAQASKAQWKVLTMHQPAYYTNVVGGNAEVHAKLPVVIDETGIDFVFSGHDHSYARTMPLTGGEVDDQNGAVYYICGSSGEKSYTATNNPDFHFAKVTQDYGGIYLGVNVTKTKFEVNVYDLDGSVIDSCTKEKADPCADGHTAIHNADGSVSCSVCGDVLQNYNGFATDAATGKQMYFMNGQYKTGWFPYGADMLHFGNDGLQHQVTKTVNPTTCLEQGVTNYKCECGATYSVAGQKPAGHNYILQDDGHYVCSACGWQRVELSECTVTLPYTVATYSGGKKVPYPTIVAPDGTTLQGNNADYYVTWQNNDKVGTATVTATAKSGYLVNLGEFRGNYGGSVKIPFEIRPQAAQNLAVTNIRTDSVTLGWDKAAGAETYKVYCSANGGKWKLYTETADTNCTLNGLEEDTSYQFRVRAKADVDGKEYAALRYSPVVEATTGTTPVPPDPAPDPDPTPDPGPAPDPDPDPTPDPDYVQAQRVAGAESAQTAAAISAEAFSGQSSEWVVIARDDDFADAMSSTGLAGALDAPILLADRNAGLSAEAVAEIARLHATKAYIIGGNGAIPANIEDQLKDLSVSAKRIFGNEAADTSVECAKAILANGGDGAKAVVAYGQNFQDALSMSSFAYAYKAPIFLQTNGATSADRSLTDEGKDMLLKGAYANAAVYVAGGNGAVSKDSVEGLLGSLRGGARIGGTDGYDTSNQIASYMVANGLLSAKTTVVASGADAAKGLDALAGAALAGKNGGVMLLANGATKADLQPQSRAAITGGDADGNASYLESNTSNVERLYVLGGQVVAPDSFVNEINALFGNGSSDNTPTTVYVNSVQMTLHVSPQTDSNAIYVPYMTELKYVGNASATDNGTWRTFEYNGQKYYGWADKNDNSDIADTKSTQSYQTNTEWQKKAVDGALAILNDGNTRYLAGHTGDVVDGKRAFDCSGFASTVINDAASSIPLYRVSANLQKLLNTGTILNEGLPGEIASHHVWGKGEELNISELQPGDLLFFSLANEAGDGGAMKDCNHVGMYLGNGEFIHCTHTWDRVIIMPLKDMYVDGLVSVQRVLPGEVTPANVVRSVVPDEGGQIVNLRDAPANSGNKIKQLRAGDKVTVQFLKDNWAYVISGDVDGYVLTRNIA